MGRSPVRLRPRQTVCKLKVNREVIEIEKIKEKHSITKGLKEKVKSVPKELVHRGLEDGSERLRLQFRDAAQQGQMDGYGGDRIEDTAVGGARRVERGVRDLLKRRKSSQWERTYGTKPPASGGGDAVLNQTAWGKTEPREAAESGACRGSGGVVFPQGSGDMPPAARLEHRGVKTQDAYIQGQTPSVQGLSREQRELAQERGRAQAKKRAGRSVLPSARKCGPGNGVAAPPETTGIKAGSTGKAGARQTTRQTVKTAEKSSRSTIKTAKEAVKSAHQAGATAQRTAQAAIRAPQRAAQAARLTAKTTADTARSAARAAAAAAKAVVAAAHSLVAAIAAGGWVVIVIVLVICLVGMLIVSPFGIFFADDSNAPDAVSPSAAVAQINGELADRLADLQESGTYDRVEVQGQPPAWPDVLAVFAAKTAGAEGGVDVAVLDPQRVNLLRTVFWDMTKITTAAETVEIPAGGNASASAEKVLIITITARTPDDMRVFYSFTSWQNEALDELLANSDMLMALAGDLTISSRDARELLADLPEDLSPERQAVVETACQLVGKLNYFWGGKSLVLGWDDRWGTLRQVTAAGSPTTGTYRPYGMDCSGYVDWVFYNATGGEYIIGHGGGAHAQHTYCNGISWKEALPGDLVFYPDDVHVGIVGGRDENGNLLIIHCASGANNVVITGVDGFTSVARPLLYDEQSLSKFASV